MAIVKFSKSGHRPDYALLAIIFMLILFGLVILASASSDLGKIKFNDTYYFLKHQLLYGFLPGLIGFFAGYKIRYQHYRKFSLIFLLVSLGLLLLVFTRFGVIAGGASRWVKAGPIAFQPSEFLKLTFVIYLAAWITNPKMNRARDFFYGAIPFFIICGIIGGILLAQPATSTVAILIGAGLALFFLSGAPFKYILTMGLVGIACLMLIIVVTPYRFTRIKTFLNPARDAQGTSYQINQSLIAIGSGGLWGMGYGRSTMKINGLPAPVGDSIFAIAAQELGFVGAGGLAVLFGALVFRMVWIARKTRDRFGQLIVVGFASVVALQSLVNMAAISGLIPLTGVPLPFVSYGGTALAVFMAMMGITANVSRYA